ncbi:hypothetical protein predicted by Glimmer/Critica [Bdellovibrio bacteriovorus HD100]|uniref:Uncharacterized protein n=1 Tax=Bdellovibrio bacteriovorus (strain ATCC 15356 / DSM 50701 / NCIMB 9529 / HD100) TaxID=264462 RepID=Q6MJB8_BDEBA|nr:hypothetical protein predicted by Glimmer/Critica [Bdellovibrio bacteriovorus HD100]
MGAFLLSAARQSAPPAELERRQARKLEQLQHSRLPPEHYKLFNSPSYFRHLGG